MSIDEVVELFAERKRTVLSTSVSQTEIFLEACERAGIVWIDGVKPTDYIPDHQNTPIIFYLFDREKGMRFSKGMRNYRPGLRLIDLNEVSMEWNDAEMPEIEPSSILDILTNAGG